MKGLPFGFSHPEQLLEPFCACGRVVSQCDKSRAACNQANSEDGRIEIRAGGAPLNEDLIAKDYPELALKRRAS